MTSGVVLSESVNCFCFYGAYDFCCLLKVLAGQNSAPGESDFFELLRMYFPVIYDIKCIMPSCPGLCEPGSSLEGLKDPSDAKPEDRSRTEPLSNASS
ncbi:hypothetical protein HPB48_008767 [Haemaphysalis longicornis]|uniref:Uncharacterized protein n=1 Tax=Haemaphysalis longicornis TaxID=44386 RepID=A0A9J6GMQ0_HAELO|nr:hypothetical protein HPB48_008767 [Haemaphysalis longicornis]